MPAITPFLWFDNQAEEAAEFYVSVFPGSKIINTTRYGEAGPGEPGSVITVDFQLDGTAFTALNGGPAFDFTEAVSFQIDCADQAEVDHYWDGLLADGGAESQCGWLKDRFGLSWQVVPRQLGSPERRLSKGDPLLGDPDPGRAARATQAMLGMRKLDIAALQAAADAS